MMCGGCVGRVKRLLEGHDSVTLASVNLATETALVRIALSETAVDIELGKDGYLMAIGSALAKVSLPQTRFTANPRSISFTINGCLLVLRKSSSLTFFLPWWLKSSSMSFSCTKCTNSWILSLLVSTCCRFQSAVL